MISFRCGRGPLPLKSVSMDFPTIGTIKILVDGGVAYTGIADEQAIEFYNRVLGYFFKGTTCGEIFLAERKLAGDTNFIHAMSIHRDAIDDTRAGDTSERFRLGKLRVVVDGMVIYHGESTPYSTGLITRFQDYYMRGVSYPEIVQQELRYVLLGTSYRQRKDYGREDRLRQLADDLVELSRRPIPFRG